MSVTMPGRPPLRVACAVEGLHDRAGVFALPNGATLVVADGAGGSGGGAIAAEAIMAGVAADPSLVDADAFASLLSRLDHGLTIGETTAVVVRIDGDRITGASVGDSGAWLIPDDPEADDYIDLTAGQSRKPLLGSRRAAPFTFSATLRHATLLLATDGLLKYARLQALVQRTRSAEFATIPQRLIDLARLRSGALPDDIALIVARPFPELSQE